MTPAELAIIDFGPDCRKTTAGTLVPIIGSHINGQQTSRVFDQDPVDYLLVYSHLQQAGIKDSNIYPTGTRGFRNSGSNSVTLARGLKNQRS